MCIRDRAKVVDYLDRNDPKKTNKPFFVWYNPARMHITTVFSPKYEACLLYTSDAADE